jgi:hypothetical protein
MSEITAADVPPPPPPPDPPPPPETRELRAPDTVDTQQIPADDFDPMADLMPAGTTLSVDADTADEHPSRDSEPADHNGGELDPMDHLEPANLGPATEQVDVTPTEPADDEQADDQADRSSAAAETAQTAATDTPAGHDREPDGRSDGVDWVDPVGEPSPDPATAGADEPTVHTIEADVSAEPQATDADIYDPLSQIDQQQDEPTGEPREDPLAAPTEAPATDDAVPSGAQTQEAPPDQPPTRDQTTVDETAADLRNTSPADSADEAVARYGNDDLNPTGSRSSIHGTELMSGPDGREHYPGDRIGTFRDTDGRLRDSTTQLFANDDNPQPTSSMQRRADRDLDNSRAHPTAAAGEASSPAEPPAGAQDVQARAAERQEIVERRAEIWTDLKPVATKLGEATNQTIGPNAFHTDRLDDLIRQARVHLTHAERLELADLGAAYIESGSQLNAASERLGTAGGAFARAQEFPDCQPVTGGDGQRGSAGNLDTIAYIDGDQPILLAFEEKGAGGSLGSRIVADPASLDGAHVRAEQGSPEYLRHMLEHDNKLTDAVRADPALTAKLQAAADCGNVRYLLVHTSSDGTVTVTDFRLDPGRIRLDNLRILRR